MKKLNLRLLSKRFAALAVIGVIGVGTLLPTTVFAAHNQAAKCAANDVKCVISAGDALIAQRQTSLTTLSNKVSTDLAAKKITSDQANALQSDSTTNSTGLANLKTRLDAETDIKAARKDVENIFLQFRIYAVVLPRDYRHIQMDVEMNAKATMQGFASTIKAAINGAPSTKQAQLNALFSDYQAQVAAAESQLDTAQNDFPAMMPENFNLNRSTYESTRLALDNALKAARVDLHQAAKDLNEIARILKIKR